MIQFRLRQLLLHLRRSYNVSRELLNLQITVISPTGRDVRDKSRGEDRYLVQPRTDIRPHDKLDALDFSLYEHDPHVLRLGRVGIPTQRLHRIRLRRKPNQVQI